ncbi:TetR family transcriptional regulator [Archangium gephyra]|uniref:TetR family transcriptional regulator n=1 Tax=Archangium gephyra TaxID=48 RepID=A0AAC8Q0V5_9BACT|nr:TetR/AcrR family transcriptional regulator [Archangium gephyra]AKI98944.1 Transcriptional regulator, TetR family [Archangium gephyra]REG30854.1 TetR family transcriptional regulator [Archangium gephyra]
MARPRQVLDEEILVAARACFIEHGASVSTEAIAARLGVSGPALLKRFGSKRELLKAAFAVGKPPPWLHLLEEGPDTRELTVQLRELAGAIDAFFRNMVPAFAVLREAGITPEEWRGENKAEIPGPARSYHAMTGWFRRAQEQGQLREGDPGVMASLFLAGLQYRYFLAHVTNESVPTEAEDPWLDRMVDTFWRGVAPEASHGKRGR